MKQEARSFVVLSQAGCLLPLLIVCNLFFGWMFLKPFHWFLLGAALVFLFWINSFVMAKRILSNRHPGSRRSDVIDVPAQVVEDNKPHAKIK